MIKTPELLNLLKFRLYFNVDKCKIVIQFDGFILFVAQEVGKLLTNTKERNNAYQRNVSSFLIERTIHNTEQVVRRRNVCRNMIAISNQLCSVRRMI